MSPTTVLFTSSLSGRDLSSSRGPHSPITSAYWINLTLVWIRPELWTVIAAVSGGDNWTIPLRPYLIFHPRYLVGLPSCFTLYFPHIYLWKQSVLACVIPRVIQSSIAISVTFVPIASFFKTAHASMLRFLYHLFQRKVLMLSRY